MERHCNVKLPWYSRCNLIIPFFFFVHLFLISISLFIKQLAPLYNLNWNRTVTNIIRCPSLVKSDSKTKSNYIGYQDWTGELYVELRNSPGFPSVSSLQVFWITSAGTFLLIFIAISLRLDLFNSSFHSKWSFHDRCQTIISFGHYTAVCGQVFLSRAVVYMPALAFLQNQEHLCNPVIICDSVYMVSET